MEDRFSSYYFTTTIFSCVEVNLCINREVLFCFTGDKMLKLLNVYLLNNRVFRNVMTKLANVYCTQSHFSPCGTQLTYAGFSYFNLIMPETSLGLPPLTQDTMCFKFHKLRCSVCGYKLLGYVWI
jgi:hypothetical protein